MQQLNHQACKPLEGSRNANTRADFDQNALGGVDVNLEFAGLVDWRVEESK